ncbi:radical SAM-linked protein [Sporomusaceae bacterium BoRhaA]|uniref:TIGR03936 family radical SAM-associated protein n=1 Tax=Pelorhabdus rhamnosifermentans TaxID=2772457 RepID=UPI001C064398|nr:TIGR03936 family radical SAM-associated protein [Pelorhabdus rhamnosifermentans]MBU2699790.1 radical SAM-linked protein [Pelorhabdus rhamnosifermentans]
MKIRMKITKEEEIRFISHLDYTRTIERAVRRAKLSAAYSEGFNPHMKFSFASALAVGVTSSAEYMDLELATDTELATIMRQLRQAFPVGITVKDSQVMIGTVKALMAVVNLATYEMTWLMSDGISEADLQQSLDLFDQEAIAIYVKQTPKGVREIDIKEFVAAPPVLHVEGDKICLQLQLHIKPTGSVKPTDMLELLIHKYQLPAFARAALIERTGLFISNKGRLLTPLEL